MEEMKSDADLHARLTALKSDKRFCRTTGCLSPLKGTVCSGLSRLDWALHTSLVGLLT